MRINYLATEHLKGIKSLELELAPVTIVSGWGGAGKTTIGEAIELLLTGRCPRTDDRGAGAEDLVYNPSPKGTKAVITGHIEGLGLVTRTIPGGLQVADWTGPATKQQEALLDHLGVDKDQIRASLQVTRFLSMAAEQQRLTLFRLLGVRLDLEGVAEHLEAWSTDNKHDPTSLRVALVGIFPKTAGDLFKALDKAARDERTKAKKGLADAEARAKAHVVPPPPEGFAPGDRPAAEKLLSKLQAERDGLIQRRGAIEPAKRALVNALQDLQQAKTDLEAAAAIATPPDVAKLEKAVTKAEALWTKSRSERDAAKDVLSGHESILTTLRDALKQFTELDTCPVSCIECNQKPEVMPELTKRIDDIGPVVAEASSRKDLAEQKTAAALTVLETARGALEDGRAVATQYADRQRLESRVAELQAKCYALPEPEDLETLQSEIATLDTRIANGKAKIEALITHAQAKNAVQHLQSAIAAARQTVATWEAMVEAMGPAGVQARILKPLVSTLAGQINDTLVQLTNGEFSVTIEAAAEFGITVHKASTGSTLPFKLLSDSESIRVGLAIADVLNQYTDLGLLVVDRGEALDPFAKQALVETCLQLAPRYGNILVLAVRGETEPVQPDIDEVAVYIMEDGTVRRAPGPVEVEA